MAGLTFVAFSITPTTSRAPGTVAIIAYTYELTLSSAEFANIAAHGSRDVDGYAAVAVWDDPECDRYSSLSDDDDLRLFGQDAHRVVCKAGTQTIARHFPVSSRAHDDDAWSDEIYLHLKVSFPGLSLEAESVSRAFLDMSGIRRYS